jgi:hypothetical protein
MFTATERLREGGGNSDKLQKRACNICKTETETETESCVICIVKLLRATKAACRFAKYQRRCVIKISSREATAAKMFTGLQVKREREHVISTN